MVHFKEAVDEKGNYSIHCAARIVRSHTSDSSVVDLERMPTIFNQLLTTLKHIIQTYHLIDSVDVLEHAAKLIHLLQGMKHATLCSHSHLTRSIAMRRSAFIG